MLLHTHIYTHHIYILTHSHTYTHTYTGRKRERNRHRERLYVKRGGLVQAWWLTPVIQELKRLGQEDHHEYNVTLAHRVRLLYENFLKNEKKVGNSRKGRQNSEGRPGCSRR